MYTFEFNYLFMHFSSMLQNFHSIFSSCCLFIFIGAVDNRFCLLCVFHNCVLVSPLMGRNVLATGSEQKIRTVVQSDGHQPCMSTASFSPKLCSNGGLHREEQWPVCHHPHALHLGVMVMIHLLLFLLISR